MISNLRKILTAFIIGSFYLITFKLAQYIFRLVLFQYQNDYRGGEPQVIHTLLAQGGDPYQLLSQPMFTNVYGIIYNLLVYPFASLFGNEVEVYRLVSLFFQILIWIIFYFVLKKLKLNFTNRVLGVLLFIAFTLSMNYGIAARPDGVGQFFFLGSILIPFYFDFKRKSLLVALIFSLLALYTKVYYAFGILYLLAYLFAFKSKTKALVLGLIALVVIGTSWFGMQALEPLYFSNVYDANANVGGSVLSYALEQFVAYFHYNIALFLILVVVVVYGVVTKKFKASVNFPALKNLVHVRRLDKPLVDIDVPIFVISLLISIFLVYIRLGRGTGTFLTYYFQLISPFLILTFLWIAQRVNFPKKVLSTLLICVIGITILTNHTRLDLPRNEIGLKRVDELVQSDDLVLGSPGIASILVEKRVTVYDSGQSEYFELSKRTDPAVQYQVEQYKAKIAQMIANKEFDYIMLIDGDTPFATEEYIKKYYDIAESYTLEFPWADGQGQGWPFNIWVRKGIDV